MKIITLRFQNLHSLRGLHEINFEEAPFSMQGIFLITGDTGAGKTTILDAVSLAMYGRTPRHSTETGKELGKKIMSRYTGECFAEVDFRIKAGSFRARWEIRRARNKHEGEMQNAVHSLIDLKTARALDLKSREIADKIAELSGLDYERFLRSVMLAQGEFARFLHAKDNERSEILERITGTEVYSEISMAAFERHKEEKEKIEKLKNQTESEGKGLLSIEEAQNKEKIWEEKQKLAEFYHKDKENILSQKNWLRKVQTLEVEKIELERQQTHIETTEKSLIPHIERLSIHQKAIKFKPEYDKWQHIQTEKQHLEAQYHEIIQIIRNIEIEYELAQQKSKQAKENLEVKKIDYESLLSLLNEKIYPLDNELIDLQEKQKDSEQKQQATRLKIEEQNTILKIEKKNAAQNHILQQETINFLATNQNFAHVQLDYVAKLYEDLQQNRDIFKANAEKIKTLETEKLALQKQLDEKNHLIASEKQNDTEAKKELQKLQIEEQQLNFVPENAHQEIQQLHIHILQIEQLAQKIKENNALFLDKQSIEKEHLSTQNELILLQNQFTHEEQQYFHAQEKLNLYEKLHEQELRIANLEQYRHKLVDGQECPLCGALHHPFAEKNRVSEAQQTENQKEGQKKICQEIQKKLHFLQNEGSQKQEKIHFLIQVIAQKTTEIEKNTAEIEAFDVFVPFEKSINAIQNIEVWGEQKRNQLQQLEKKQKIWQILHKRIKETEQKLAQLEKYIALQEFDRERELHKLQNLVLQLQNVTEENENLKTIGNQQKQTLQNQLALYQVEVPKNEKEWKEIAHLLTTKTEQYKQYYEQKQSIENQYIRIETAIKNAEQQLNNWEAEDKEWNEKINQTKTRMNEKQEMRFQLFGDKNPHTEILRLKNQIENAQKAVEQTNNTENQLFTQIETNKGKKTFLEEKIPIIQQEIQFLENELRAKLQENELGNPFELPSYWLEEQEYAQYSQKIQDFYHQKNAVATLLADKKQTLDIEKSKQYTEFSLEEIEIKLKNVESNLQELTSDISEIKVRLQDHQNALQKLASIQEEINQQEKMYRKWHLLNELIGSAKGDKFSKFAQGLTLMQLIDCANRHLMRLNDRYVLKKDEKGQTEMGILIVDTYMADDERNIKTLSGGETFLVSLALALGLSDMAGRNNRIETLFIDEGFGTLDPTSLDIAIDALENLQSDGRMVGVISHIELLKNRITTQIVVQKHSNGISKIEKRGLLTQ